MSTEHVERMAKRNLERGERWHKKLSIKEIVFGFQDNSIAILALLAGVTGGSLQRGQILLAGLAAVVGGANRCSYWKLHLFQIRTGVF